MKVQGGEKSIKQIIEDADLTHWDKLCTVSSIITGTASVIWAIMGITPYAIWSCGFLWGIINIWYYAKIMFKV